MSGREESKKCKKALLHFVQQFCMALNSFHKQSKCNNKKKIQNNTLVDKLGEKVRNEVPVVYSITHVQYTRTESGH